MGIWENATLKVSVLKNALGYGKSFYWRTFGNGVQAEFAAPSQAIDQTDTTLTVQQFLCGHLIFEGSGNTTSALPTVASLVAALFPGSEGHPQLIVGTTFYLTVTNNDDTQTWTLATNTGWTNEMSNALAALDPGRVVRIRCRCTNATVGAEAFSFMFDRGSQT